MESPNLNFKEQARKFVWYSFRALKTGKTGLFPELNLIPLLLKQPVSFRQEVGDQILQSALDQEELVQPLEAGLLLY